MTELSAFEADLITDALKQATAFFIARDEMNSQVHLAEVRYSPITEGVALAWNVMNDKLGDK